MLASGIMVVFIRYCFIACLIGIFIFYNTNFLLPGECALDVISYTASIPCILALWINGFIMYCTFSMVFDLKKVVFLIFISLYIFKWIALMINIQSFIVPFDTWAPVFGIMSAYICRTMVLDHYFKNNK